jgi:hypothetical protein
VEVEPLHRRTVVEVDVTDRCRLPAQERVDLDEEITA